MPDDYRIKKALEEGAKVVDLLSDEAKESYFSNEIPIYKFDDGTFSTWNKCFYSIEEMSDYLERMNRGWKEASEGLSEFFIDDIDIESKTWVNVNQRYYDERNEAWVRAHNSIDGLSEKAKKVIKSELVQDFYMFDDVVCVRGEICRDYHSLEEMEADFEEIHDVLGL